MKETIFYRAFVLVILARRHRILYDVVSKYPGDSRAISFDESSLPMHVVVLKLSPVLNKFRMVFPDINSLLALLSVQELSLVNVAVGKLL